MSNENTNVVETPEVATGRKAADRTLYATIEEATANKPNDEGKKYPRKLFTVYGPGETIRFTYATDNWSATLNAVFTDESYKATAVATGVRGKPTLSTVRSVFAEMTPDERLAFLKEEEKKAKAEKKAQEKAAKEGTPPTENESAPEGNTEAA